MLGFELTVNFAVSGAIAGTVEVKPEQTLGEVKKSLEGVSKVPVRYQKLCCSSADQEYNVYRDEDILGAAGIQQSTLLSLFVSPVEPMDFVQAVRDGANNLDLLRYMLSHGAEINATTSAVAHRPSLNDPLDRDKYVLSIGLLQASALHHAASHGCLEVARFLIAHPDFTETDSLTLAGPYDEEAHPEALQLTSLHVAALAGHQDMCLLLLGCNAFHRVDDCIRVSHDPYPANPTALAFACMNGLSDVVHALLKDPRCTSLNCFVDNYGTTLLMLAASRKSRGNSRVCMMIIDDPRFTLVEEAGHAYGHINHLLAVHPDARMQQAGGVPKFYTAHGFAKYSGLQDIAHLLDKLQRQRNQIDEPQSVHVETAPIIRPEIPETILAAAKRAAAKAVAADRSVSTLSGTEKDFLKAVKDFRAILKLKEKKGACGHLDAAQEKKLERKDEALRELQVMELKLSQTSSLRDKNKDIISMINE